MMIDRLDRYDLLMRRAVKKPFGVLLMLSLAIFVTSSCKGMRDIHIEEAYQEELPVTIQAKVSAGGDGGRAFRADPDKGTVVKDGELDLTSNDPGEPDEYAIHSIRLIAFPATPDKSGKAIKNIYFYTGTEPSGLPPGVECKPLNKVSGENANKVYDLDFELDKAGTYTFYLIANEVNYLTENGGDGNVKLNPNDFTTEEEMIQKNRISDEPNGFKGILTDQYSDPGSNSASQIVTTKGITMVGKETIQVMHLGENQSDTRQILPPAIVLERIVSKIDFHIKNYTEDVEPNDPQAGSSMGSSRSIRITKIELKNQGIRTSLFHEPEDYLKTDIGRLGDPDFTTGRLVKEYDPEDSESPVFYQNPYKRRLVAYVTERFGMVQEPETDPNFYKKHTTTINIYAKKEDGGVMQDVMYSIPFILNIAGTDDKRLYMGRNELYSVCVVVRSNRVDVEYTFKVAPWEKVTLPAVETKPGEEVID